MSFMSRMHQSLSRLLNYSYAATFAGRSSSSPWPYAYDVMMAYSNYMKIHLGRCAITSTDRVIWYDENGGGSSNINCVRIYYVNKDDQFVNNFTGAYEGDIPNSNDILGYPAYGGQYNRAPFNTRKITQWGAGIASSTNNSSFVYVNCICADDNGNIYFSQFHSIYKSSGPSSTAVNIAGASHGTTYNTIVGAYWDNWNSSSKFGSTDASGSSARFNQPRDILSTPSGGTLFVLDLNGVRRVTDKNGVWQVTTISTSVMRCFDLDTVNSCLYAINDDGLIKKITNINSTTISSITTTNWLDLKTLLPNAFRTDQILDYGTNSISSMVHGIAVDDVNQFLYVAYVNDIGNPFGDNDVNFKRYGRASQIAKIRISDKTIVDTIGAPVGHAQIDGNDKTKVTFTGITALKYKNGYLWVTDNDRRIDLSTARVPPGGDSDLTTGGQLGAFWSRTSKIIYFNNYFYGSVEVPIHINVYAGDAIYLRQGGPTGVFLGFVKYSQKNVTQIELVDYPPTGPGDDTESGFYSLPINIRNSNIYGEDTVAFKKIRRISTNENYAIMSISNPLRYVTPSNEEGITGDSIDGETGHSSFYNLQSIVCNKNTGYLYVLESTGSVGYLGVFNKLRKISPDGFTTTLLNSSEYPTGSAPLRWSSVYFTVSEIYTQLTIDQVSGNMYCALKYTILKIVDGDGGDGISPSRVIGDRIDYANQSPDLVHQNQHAGSPAQVDGTGNNVVFEHIRAVAVDLTGENLYIMDNLNLRVLNFQTNTVITLKTNFVTSPPVLQTGYIADKDEPAVVGAGIPQVARSYRPSMVVDPSNKYLFYTDGGYIKCIDLDSYNIAISFANRLANGAFVTDGKGLASKNNYNSYRDVRALQFDNNSMLYFSESVYYPYTSGATDTTNYIKVEHADGIDSSIRRYSPIVYDENNNPYMNTLTTIIGDYGTVNTIESRLVGFLNTVSELPANYSGALYDYYRLNTGENQYWNGSAWVNQSTLLSISNTSVPGSKHFARRGYTDGPLVANPESVTDNKVYKTITYNKDSIVARLDSPNGIAFNSKNQMFIADNGNFRVVKVT